MLSARAIASSSIRRAIAGIASIHILNNYPSPLQDADVKISMRRMNRKLGRHCKQAEGITKDILNEMVSATDNTLHGLRDRALLLLAYDMLCRRSEIIKILVEDIQPRLVYGSRNITSMAVFLRQSKTDQESHGKWIPIRDETNQAIEKWLALSGIKTGLIFRGIHGHTLTNGLDIGNISRIFKRIAKAAKLAEELVENISSHSIRVGAAQDLLLSGASLPIIMNKGRWSKSDTVMRYVEKVGIPI